ncbi:hypothetical protein LCGC14_0689140 [marine sediment metagenome]|uniref:Uncharacterized protein n=1 Tax=marine sediment metagenome TaxID=412755 RepID=A0A0F9TTZ5_9ZZZZ
MKFSRIKMGRQGNFILGLLLIFFVFFGYISNQFPRDDSTNLLPIGQELIFLYQILFDPGSFLSLIILFGIMFIVALRESFFEFAIRNSIWYIPAILMMSWFWYWFLFGFDATVFYIYFIRIEGYLTILALLSINLLAAISASILNEKRKELRESKY